MEPVPVVTLTDENRRGLLGQEGPDGHPVFQPDLSGSSRQVILEIFSDAATTAAAECAGAHGKR